MTNDKWSDSNVIELIQVYAKVKIGVYEDLVSNIDTSIGALTTLREEFEEHIEGVNGEMVALANAVEDNPESVEVDIKKIQTTGMDDFVGADKVRELLRLKRHEALFHDVATKLIFGDILKELKDKE